MATRAVPVFGLILAAIALLAAQADARPRKRRPVRAAVNPHVRAAPDAPATPAVRYARLTPTECLAEVRRRDLPVAPVDSARGVLAPVRLTGPLRGVAYRTRLAASARATSPWEIADCRLVLALDDFAEILARHGVVEVRHYSMYRPPRDGWAEDRIAGQHNGALALDAGAFIRRDGTELDVDRDFHGRRGAVTCGERARPRRKTEAALALRALLCEAVDRRLFNIVLTPNHNRAHKNHFHLEVMAGVGWFLVD